MYTYIHTRLPRANAFPTPNPPQTTDFVIVDESQDLRAEDVEILGRLVEQQARHGGALKRALVVGGMWAGRVANGLDTCTQVAWKRSQPIHITPYLPSLADTEQTVFSDVIAQESEHPLDLLPSWMPSVDILARRLDINYRCVLVWT